jgi:hypothetical protein
MNKLFLIAIVLLSGCSSLNKVESTREMNKNSNEYTYSDPDSKIRYDISNDAKNLYIRLNTADYPTISKILMTGLKVCFDLNGKKSNKFYFEYPLPQDRQSQGQRRPRPAGGEPAGFNLNRLVEQISNEGEFDRNGVKERIVLVSTDSDVKPTIRAINNSEIVYDLTMPLNRISKDGIAALSKLSIGIVAGKDDASSSGSARPGGGGGGGRSGGMGGGGGRSGGGRGGMGGGGRSGGMGGEGGGGHSGGASREGGGSGDRSFMSKPVDFWFKLELSKTN